MRLSVVGLGKLGLCTAMYFASKGHKVIGVEKNDYFISELQRRRCPISETGLAELLEKAWDNLEVTADVQTAVSHSDITLIIVPTPSEADGKFSNRQVEEVLRSVGPALGSKDDFHVVNVVSTVMPGSCEQAFKPLLEELSGRICGRDFGLAYNPEFIALGSVIKDFSRPDMVLIGASDECSAQMVKQLYLGSCENEPHIAMMSLLNAEITKLSLNCFVTMKISFANELSNICEKLAGADVDVITGALGSDSRIGSKYLQGGLGFGGTCFPRDNIAFQAFTKEVGYDAKLSKAAVAINDEIVDKLFGLIKTNTLDGKHVCLLGLSYKPHTHITEQSQSIMLAQKLTDASYRVTVYDPMASDSAKEVLGDSITYFNDPYECADCCDAVVLLTKWPEFKDLDWDEIDRSVNEGAVLLDSWRELKDKKFTRLNYIGLGLGCSEKLSCIL